MASSAVDSVGKRLTVPVGVDMVMVGALIVTADPAVIVFVVAIVSVEAPPTVVLDVFDMFEVFDPDAVSVMSAAESSMFLSVVLVQFPAASTDW